MFRFEDCNYIDPLTTEQQSLPWGPWVWDSAFREYRRSCEPTQQDIGTCKGLPFSPELAFCGRLVVFQRAKIGVPKRQRITDTKDISRLIISRLGRIPTEWRCFYCDKFGTPIAGPDERTWHVDHSYPHALGGDDESDNKVLSCATCNLKKSATTAAEFRKKQEVAACG